jgi:hypothetical protein
VETTTGSHSIIEQTKVTTIYNWKQATCVREYGVGYIRSFLLSHIVPQFRSPPQPHAAAPPPPCSSPSPTWGRGGGGQGAGPAVTVKLKLPTADGRAGSAGLGRHHPPHRHPRSEIGVVRSTHQQVTGPDCLRLRLAPASTSSGRAAPLAAQPQPPHCTDSTSAPGAGWRVWAGVWRDAWVRLGCVVGCRLPPSCASCMRQCPCQCPCPAELNNTNATTRAT